MALLLWATDDTVKAMFDVEKLDKDGSVGARFTADGMTVEVTFAKTGDLGAHLRLSKGNTVIVNRALANTVEDVYAKWKSDPRFRNWMTNDAMKAVIRAREVDAWRQANPQKNTGDNK